MLKFFRKIRQNLLSEGKTGKYLKYAIGEIVLVVIGILIALQINNWNEKRKENHRVTSLLKGMIEELKTDSTSLSYYIKEYEHQSKSCIELLNDSLFSTIPTDSLVRKLLLNQTDLALNSQAFEKIKNASLSNLLGNPELDKYISYYYISSATFAETQIQWEQKETEKYEDFWFTTLNMEFPMMSGTSLNNIPYKQSEAKRKNILLSVINSIEGRKRIRFALDRKQLVLHTLKGRKKFAGDLISWLEENLEN